jgi:hypothetical protein
MPCLEKNLLYEVDKNSNKELSPSIDRMIPELGYVKGNIKSISYEANRIKKNDCTIEIFGKPY